MDIISEVWNTLLDKVGFKKKEKKNMHNVMLFPSS